MTANLRFTFTELEIIMSSTRTSQIALFDDGTKLKSAYAGRSKA